MKTIFILIFLFGAAQLALASSAAPSSLLGQANIGILENLALLSVHGSMGLLGGLCFLGTVSSRFRRRGR